MTDPQRFCFLTDLHFGYERRNGHKVPLHDLKAMNVALQFVADFHPNVIILGGDILDCGPVSHHNRNKPGRTEGLRLVGDAQECHQQFISQLPDTSQLVYIMGNHERWLEDVVDDMPGLEGLLDIRNLLSLPAATTVIPQGEHFQLGKLVFVHGDQLSGGEHIAKAAVIAYEKSIRFGHHHTHQLYTKNSPLHHKAPKTGMAVGCLCRKDPHYGRGKPNRWSQGFLHGYVEKDGNYQDYHTTIINGRAVVNGHRYEG